MSRSRSSRPASSRTRPSAGTCGAAPTSSGSPPASPPASQPSSASQLEPWPFWPWLGTVPGHGPSGRVGAKQQRQHLSTGSGPLDTDADDRLEVVERNPLEPLVDRGASVSEHGNLEPALPGVDRRLRHATLGRGAGEEEPLDLERAQDQLERGLVEGGVARLDNEAVAVLRHDRRHQLPTPPGERAPHEFRCVAVPDAEVVVRVQDRHLSGTSPAQRADKRSVPHAERLQQARPVLVLEVVDEIDEEESVLHSAGRPRILSAASRPRSCTERRRSSTSGGAPGAARSTVVSADSNSSRAVTSPRDSSSLWRSSAARGSSSAA